MGRPCSHKKTIAVISAEYTGCCALILQSQLSNCHLDDILRAAYLEGWYPSFSEKRLVPIARQHQRAAWYI